MKELTVISGKGGTGKTSVVSSFAALASDAVVVDCDVDAPDLHLVLEPTPVQQRPFVGGQLARIDAARCTGCGRCAEVCRFDAVRCNGPAKQAKPSSYTIDPLSCEGCRVCVEICPEKAIESLPATNGEWFISRTRHGPMVHAQLGVAEDNSGKLVSLLRQQARALAQREQRELLICDGPPGIACPVIASLTGTSLVLIVIEPTLSGLHDFERVLELVEHFGLPAIACINKFDVSVKMAERIAATAAHHGVDVIGRIPYDRAVVEAQLCSTSVVEHGDGSASSALREIWQSVKQRLDRSAPVNAAGSATV
jgi:MinD superfamily P-loop ATPase